MSVIAFSRAIGPVPISCLLSEKHTSTLEITEIPIETGAKITDHAVVMPKAVTLEAIGENAAATLEALIRFQESRVPFTLVTGLKIYQNMLVKRIDADRDSSFARILRATVDLQEVILVSTAYAADPNGEPNGSKVRGKPGGTKSTRAAPPASDRASGIAAERAAGTVQTGDNATKTIPDQSILRGLYQ